jgi:tripeptidyl-peptidase-1
MVRAKASFSIWEQLLQTEFHMYESKTLRAQGKLQTHIAAETYSVPAHLDEHISAVLGSVEFPISSLRGKMPNHEKSSTMKTSGRAEVRRDTGITPDVLRKAYSMPPVAKPGSTEEKQRANVTQAVFASLDQYFSPSDLEAFQELFALPRRPVHELDDGHHSNDRECILNANSCGEANLDVQYMLAMSPWSRMGFWYYSQDSVDMFTEFLETLTNTQDPPEVLSISYGGNECAHSQGEINTFDQLAQKLGLMGVTLVASSGDDGAQGQGARSTRTCETTVLLGLAVEWPASSPYVTAVGATMGPEANKSETACQITCQEGKLAQGACTPDVDEVTGALNGPAITTGGGYSSTIGRPSWQTGHNPCSNRGIPDVSLAGHQYNVYVGGELISVDGTSASAPTFGGMLSLINARRKAAGKSSVGFINPAMYQADASAFNDITDGDNGCGSIQDLDLNQQVLCCGGYKARPGWDAVTGLGSINFAKFEAIFDGLP